MTLDELNCPACDEEPLMEVSEGSLEVDMTDVDATFITCPNCGFQITAQSAQTAELAVRALQGPLFRAICEAAEAEETST